MASPLQLDNRPRIARRERFEADSSHRPVAGRIGPSPLASVAMVYRKGERQSWKVLQDWAHHVAIAVPQERGLGRRLDAMRAFCQGKEYATTPGTISARDREAMVWCFKSADDAFAFRTWYEKTYARPIRLNETIVQLDDLARSTGFEDDELRKALRHAQDVARALLENVRKAEWVVEPAHHPASIVG